MAEEAFEQEYLSSHLSTAFIYMGYRFRMDQYVNKWAY